jgi:hypothetical protein
MKTKQGISTLVSSIALTFGILAACGGGSGGSGNGGGGGGTIRASDYDQSCAKASDCVAIYAGVASCCGGSCDNAAINKSDESKYESDLAADKPTDCTGMACPAIACETPGVACVAGKCAIQSKTLDSGKPDSGGTACGKETCASGDVCVMNQFEGGAIHPPNDAGMCPDGDVRSGSSCNPEPTFHCAPSPSGCSKGLSCACAMTLCQSGYTCMDAKDDLVECYLEAP